MGLAWADITLGRQAGRCLRAAAARRCSNPLCSLSTPCATNERTHTVNHTRVFLSVSFAKRSAPRSAYRLDVDGTGQVVDRRGGVVHGAHTAQTSQRRTTTISPHAILEHSGNILLSTSINIIPNSQKGSPIASHLQHYRRCTEAVSILVSMLRLTPKSLASHLSTQSNLVSPTEMPLAPKMSAVPSTVYQKLIPASSVLPGGPVLAQFSSATPAQADAAVL